MSVEILHQLGHNYVWNLSSLLEDHCGDGLILSPKFMDKAKVEALSESLKIISIFDPQFFNPHEQVGKLSFYDFFPGVLSDGFDTSEYCDGNASICAEKCVAFQKEHLFKTIIIPTRYSSGMPSSFISNQENLFVKPFIDAIHKLGKEKPVLLQLIVNYDMIKDAEYSNQLLNWITSFQDIDGVYLIADVKRSQKQIKDIDFLFCYLRFIDSLRVNNMLVLLGYQNTESALLSLASPTAVTIGSYENLRIFNISNFENQENPSHGPKPRIYVSQLFQWIDTNYVGAITRAKGNTDIFDDNKYKVLMFEPSYHWHFAKPELYKHYFLVFCNQMKNITSVDSSDRYHLLSSMLINAYSEFRFMEERGIVLDQNSDGSHIPAWLTVANQFAEFKGWR